MNEITMVKHINSYGNVLASIVCYSMQEIRTAVGDILDILADGDKIEFEVVAS